VLERRANHRSADVKHPVQSILHQASNARLLMKGSYEELLTTKAIDTKLVTTIAPAKSLLSNPLH
jgi:hypothetical protein